MTLELLAPAKLTLSLRVLGVRDDGFHELDALTVSIDAPCDALTVEPGPPGIRLSVSGPASAGVPNDDDNLVAHAALAVLPDDEGLEIGLHKQIPPGSGLGGGSSDAAAVLRVCADTYGLDPEVVAEAAAAVGSDIPFCLQQAPAWMRGRGEIIDPVALPEALRVLVVVPPFSISTARGLPGLGRAGRPPQHPGDPGAGAGGLPAGRARERPRAGGRAGRAPAGPVPGCPGSGGRGAGRCWRAVGRRAGSRSRTRRMAAAAARVEAALGLPAHLGTTLPTAGGG